jgi:hypothetical protein
MRSRYLSLAAIVIVLVAVFLFWNGPHSARGSGQNVVVLCSSCVYDKAGDGFGNPKVGIFLLDSDRGDIWVRQTRSTGESWFSVTRWRGQIIEQLRTGTLLIVGHFPRCDRGSGCRHIIQRRFDKEQRQELAH